MNAGVMFKLLPYTAVACRKISLYQTDGIAGTMICLCASRINTSIRKLYTLELNREFDGNDLCNNFS